MIFVWRGWAGALGAFLMILGGGAGAGYGGSLGNPALGAGIGLLVAGVASFFLGRYANLQQPVQKVQEYAAGRRAALQQTVDAGTFHLGAGHAAPQSYAEAQAQADAVVAAETQQLQTALHNRHSFFFIPIQYLGAFAAVGGALLLVLGLVVQFAA